MTAKKEDIENLSSRVRDIETTKRQMVDAVVTLSERIAVLISYNDLQTHAIKNTLLALWNCNLKNAPKSFHQFFERVHNWSKDTYLELQNYHYDIIPKTQSFHSPFQPQSFEPQNFPEDLKSN